MLKVIKDLLVKIVNNIDAGNSSLSEEEAIKVIEVLRELTNKERGLSKSAACRYLNISRATFDNYVREGKLPKGKHDLGFKELSWDKKSLNEFIKQNKQRNS